MLHRDCETLRRGRSYPHGGLLVHTHYLPDSPFSGMRFWTSTVVLFFSNVYRGLNRSGPPAPTLPPYRRPSVCVAEALLPRVRLPLLVQSGRSARPHVRPRLGSPSLARLRSSPGRSGFGPLARRATRAVAHLLGRSTTTCDGCD
jgi:hypothetical protein